MHMEIIYENQDLTYNHPKQTKWIIELEEKTIVLIQQRQNSPSTSCSNITAANTSAITAAF